MPSNAFQIFPNQRVCKDVPPKIGVCNPSSDDWQVLLSQLWAVVLRDLDAALLSKYVRDGKGLRFGYRYLQFQRDGRAFSGQCFLSECTNGMHKQNHTNIPIISTKSNMYELMYITFMELFSNLDFETQRRS